MDLYRFEQMVLDAGNQVLEDARHFTARVMSQDRDWDALLALGSNLKESIDLYHHAMAVWRRRTGLDRGNAEVPLAGKDSAKGVPHPEGSRQASHLPR